MSRSALLTTAQLQNWLPHRAPMVWIDEVGETSELGGTCYVTLRADGLYLSEGSLRKTSIIEFLAQGFGYIAAAHKVRSGAAHPPPTQRAFLVAVTHCLLGNTNAAVAGIRLVISVSDVKQVGPIQLFKGSVSTETGEVLGTANLKVFSE